MDPVNAPDGPGDQHFITVFIIAILIISIYYHRKKEPKIVLLIRTGPNTAAPKTLRWFASRPRPLRKLQKATPEIHNLNNIGARIIRIGLWLWVFL